MFALGAQHRCLTVWRKREGRQGRERGIVFGSHHRSLANWRRRCIEKKGGEKDHTLASLWNKGCKCWTTVPARGYRDGQTLFSPLDLRSKAIVCLSVLARMGLVRGRWTVRTVHGNKSPRKFDHVEQFFCIFSHWHELLKETDSNKISFQGKMTF